ncbi:MAG: hypothetical protein ACOYK6_06495 [Chthoniobacterales bacterium]
MLFITAITLGILLILKHLVACTAPIFSKKFLQHFPRSSFWGILLLTIAGIWAFVLVATTDLGEFSPMRYFILVGIVVGTGLFGWLAPDFLAVRSLGFVALLAAHPVLEITFLQSGWTSILLSILAYIWIIAGLFLVGIPYLLRNIITTITAPEHQRLWNLLAFLGLSYGLVLVASGAWTLLKS